MTAVRFVESVCRTARSGAGSLVRGASGEAPARRSDSRRTRLAWDGCHSVAASPLPSTHPGTRFGTDHGPTAALAVQGVPDEAYVSAQRPEASPQAWFSTTHAHSRRAGHRPQPAGKRPSSTERLIAPITDRATFRALSRRGRRGKVEQLRLSAILEHDESVSSNGDEDGPRGPSTVRVAFAISRRVGGAVIRNRLRRRLRAIIGELQRSADDPLPPGSYLFLAEPGLGQVPYAELGTRVRAVIGQVCSNGSGPS